MGGPGGAFLRTRSPLLLLWMLGAALVATACDDGGVLVGTRSLARDDLVGAYVATTLVVTLGAEQIDVLGEGGSLFITLEPAGTTTGAIFVPEAVGGEELTAELSGTWVFRNEGPIVTFEQDADTFVRDLTFRAGCAEDETIQLRSDEILLGNRFLVVLSRLSTVQFPDIACP